jgi:hypothetical protein
MLPPIVAPAPKIAALPLLMSACDCVEVAEVPEAMTYSFFPNFLPISAPLPGLLSTGCSAIAIGGTELL